jgi:hypothetical protein
MLLPIAVAFLIGRTIHMAIAHKRLNILSVIVLLLLVAIGAAFRIFGFMRVLVSALALLVGLTYHQLTACEADRKGQKTAFPLLLILIIALLFPLTFVITYKGTQLLYQKAHPGVKIIEPSWLRPWFR